MDWKMLGLGIGIGAIAGAAIGVIIGSGTRLNGELAEITEQAIRDLKERGPVWGTGYNPIWHELGIYTQNAVVDLRNGKIWSLIEPTARAAQVMQKDVFVD